MDPDSLDAESCVALFELHLSVGDIKDCFHNLRNRSELGRHFCLPPIRAGLVGLTGTVLDGMILKADDLVWPYPGSLPLGFAWAPYFSQDMAETVSARCTEAALVPILSDHSAVGVLRHTC